MIKFALQLFKFGAVPLAKEGKLGKFKLGNHVIEIQLSSIFTPTNVVSWMCPNREWPNSGAYSISENILRILAKTAL